MALGKSFGFLCYPDSHLWKRAGTADSPCKGLQVHWIKAEQLEAFVTRSFEMSALPESKSADTCADGPKPCCWTCWAWGMWRAEGSSSWWWALLDLCCGACTKCCDFAEFLLLLLCLSAGWEAGPLKPYSWKLAHATSQQTPVKGGERRQEVGGRGWDGRELLLLEQS